MSCIYVDDNALTNQLVARSACVVPCVARIAFFGGQALCSPADLTVNGLMHFPSSFSSSRKLQPPVQTNRQTSLVIVYNTFLVSLVALTRLCEGEQLIIHKRIPTTQEKQRGSHH